MAQDGSHENPNGKRGGRSPAAMPFGLIPDAHTGSSPEAMFRRAPPVSKGLLVAMVGMLFFQAFNFLNYHHCFLTSPLVRERFNVWRILTCLMFPGQPSYMALFHIIMTMMYSLWYEKDGFNTGGGGGSADYAFMLLFGLVVMEAVELLLFHKPFILMGSALYFYICYVWSRKNPRMPIDVWGVVLSAVYVPWVMLAVLILIGESIHMPLLGIAVGYCYYFIVDILPDLLDIDLLHTPKCFIHIFS